MIGGQYKNIVLVTAILGGFVLFMIVASAWVINDVSKGRSCYRTCETPQKGAKEQKGLKEIKKFKHLEKIKKETAP